MTDEQNLETNQVATDNTVQSNTGVNEGQQQTAPVVNTEQSKASPTFTRDQLAVASNAAKQAGIEQGKKEALRELETQTSVNQQQVADQQQVQPQIPQGQPGQQGAPPQFNQEDVNRMVNDAIAQRAQQQEYEKHYNELSNKLSAAQQDAEKYPNLQQNLAGLGIREDPNWYSQDAMAAEKVSVVMWANQLPNTVEVLSELGRNPNLYLQVLGAAKNINPQAANTMLSNLSNSLAQNQQASSQTFPNEPLGQMKSTATGRDNGSFTVADIKASPSMKA